MTNPTGDALKASAAQVLDMIVDEIAIARFDCLSDLEAAERILFAVAGARPLDPATEGKLREALRFAASRSVMTADDEKRIIAALSPVEQAPQPVAVEAHSVSDETIVTLAYEHLRGVNMPAILMQKTDKANGVDVGTLPTPALRQFIDAILAAVPPPSTRVTPAPTEAPPVESQAATPHRPQAGLEERFGPISDELWGEYLEWRAALAAEGSAE